MDQLNHHFDQTEIYLANVLLFEGAYEREKILSSIDQSRINNIGLKAVVCGCNEGLAKGLTPDLSYCMEFAKKNFGFNDLVKVVSDFSGGTTNWETHLKVFQEKQRVEKAVKILTEQLKNSKNSSLKDIQFSVQKVLDIDDGIGEEDGSLEKTAEELLNPKESLTIETGLSQLDSALGGGVAKSEYTIIAGRPGMGKSAISTSLTRHMIFNGKRGLIISMEMSKKQVLARIIADLTGISSAKQTKGFKYLTQSEKLDIAHHAQEIVSTGLSVYCPASPDVESIRSIIIKEHLKKPLDFVIIDHIGLIECNQNATRNDKMGHISRTLKKIVQEYEDIALIALCQLSRDSVKGDGKRPQLHHLRDSGNLEQDAQVVVFIHREAMYSEDAEAQKKPHQAELIIAKNRDGMTGTAVTNFYPSRTSFRD